MWMRRCACAKRPQLDCHSIRRAERKAMSDLQIGLAILDALIVIAVLAFNYWQERQFQRRGEQAFTVPHDDVLLDRTSVPDAKSSAPAPAGDDIRIEPRMEPELQV